jgi:hypothetical protein
MSQTVVDSTNQVQFAETGKVEPPKEEVKAEEVKVEEVKEPEKSDDDDLPERVKKIIGKKHRAMKEAEEFAQEQFFARRALEKELEQREARIREFEAQSAPKVEEDKPPAQADYPDAEKYWDAKIKYEANKAVKADREVRAREQAEAAREAAEADFRSRLKASAAEFPDWESVVEAAAGTADEARLSADITQYVKESEHPARLLYYFASNPEVLAELNALSPHKAVARVGQLEVALSQKAPKEPAKEEAKTPAPQAKPAPKTPEPITPIPAGGSTPVHKDLRDMTTRETIEYWEARDRARAHKRQRH